MAKRIETIVHLIDDIDGGKATTTVPFGIDGKLYEIDLSTKNAKQLEKVLRPFLEAARPQKRPAASAKRKLRHGPTQGQVRAWAQAEGLEIGDRGRVPNSIYEAYAAAH